MAKMLHDCPATLPFFGFTMEVCSAFSSSISTANLWRYMQGLLNRATCGAPTSDWCTGFMSSSEETQPDEMHYIVRAKCDYNFV